MELLYCDESNLEKKPGEFFVYAGLVVPGITAKALSDEVREIRKSFSVPANQGHKFNPPPLNLTHERFINYKTQLVHSATKWGCKLLASTILHDIATSPAEARLKEINRVLLNYEPPPVALT